MSWSSNLQEQVVAAMLAAKNSHPVSYAGSLHVVSAGGWEDEDVIYLIYKAVNKAAR